MIEAVDFGLILAPTFRSRAILQIFEQEGIRIPSAILLPGVEPNWQNKDVINIKSYSDEYKTYEFRPYEEIRETLTRQNITLIDAPTQDINSEEFVKFVTQQGPKIFIYSGMAGVILRKDILNSGKRFIHAHGGDAPRYSGSTAFYYSILENGSFGATVFWMDEGLDTGDIIEKLVTAPVYGVEIDRVQDPLLRAQAFALAVKKLLSKDVFANVQNHTLRKTYHVVHPVLKHYALRKCGLGKD